MGKSLKWGIIFRCRNVAEAQFRGKETSKSQCRFRTSILHASFGCRENKGKAKENERKGVETEENLFLISKFTDRTECRCFFFLIVLLSSLKLYSHLFAGTRRF